MIKVITKTSKLKKRIKVSKKKNPTDKDIYEDYSPPNFKGGEEIGNDIESYLKKNSENFSKIGSGDFAEVHKFKLTKRLFINNKFLDKGTYVIKIYYADELKRFEIDKLTLLSKYGLIPKIYVITKYYIIMDYIDGYTLEYIKSEYFKKDYTNDEYWKIRKYIDDKVNNLRIVWDRLGFYHGDLNPKNIIVSKNLKSVYLIDPWTAD